MSEPTAWLVDYTGVADPSWGEFPKMPFTTDRVSDVFAAREHGATVTPLVPASALEAERERCAKLVEDADPETFNVWDVADAIRALPSPPVTEGP